MMAPRCRPGRSHEARLPDDDTSTVTIAGCDRARPVSTAARVTPSGHRCTTRPFVRTGSRGPIGRAVTLTLDGESPMRSFDAPPHVHVLIGDREVGAFDPAADFDQSFTLPADLLAAANGRVTLISSRFFVPGGKGGAGDQRHLALRIYDVSVRVD